MYSRRQCLIELPAYSRCKTWTGLTSCNARTISDFLRRLSDSVGPVCPQKLPDIANEQEALERMPKGRLEYLKRLLPHLRNQSEDCLYLNIYAPAMGEYSEYERFPRDWWATLQSSLKKKKKKRNDDNLTDIDKSNF